MREKILNLLPDDDYISGEELSRIIGISRTGVWKHIQELKKEGFEILSQPRRGYRLASVPDLLLPSLLKKHLKTEIIGKEIHHYYSIPSTNDKAREIAAQDAPEGSIVVAEKQLQGKGRLGRTWSSPPGGIWVSVILRPPISPPESQLITLVAGLAVARCLQEYCNTAAGIKWPNDIMVGGKKICGILTEIRAEVDRVHFLALGIGLNVNTGQEDYPIEVRDLITSLKLLTDSEWNRRALLSVLLESVEREYFLFLKEGKGRIIEKWKMYDVTLNNYVTVKSGNKSYSGTAVDLSDNGGLILQVEDGTLLTVYSGEVL